MRKYIIFGIIVCFSFFIYSQSSFKELSSPKKWWVVAHPFKAKKSLIISKEISKVADSIRKTKTLDGDKVGGQVDAFRHAFWMARLAQVIGKKAAKSLGEAHEKENYQYFLEKKLEDGILPDKASMDMDLHNNNIGLTLVKKGEIISKKEIIQRVINAILKGKMLIMKKDTKKRYLTCEGKIIAKQELKGNWINAKCLITSNKSVE